MAPDRVRADLTTPSRRALLGAAGAAAIFGTPSANAAPRFSGTDWIPFDDHLGSIRFPGAVNGRRVTLTLDSGVGGAAVDRGMARSLGLASSGRRNLFRGFASDRPGEWSRPYTLALAGAAPLTMPGAALVDLSALEAEGGSSPFLIGLDIFNISVVEIDFANRRLAFRPLGFTPDPGLKRTVLGPGSGGVLEIQISIEGHPPVWAEFDLGAESALSLDKAYADRVGLLRGRPTSTWISAGVDGIIPHHTATAANVIVAGGAVADVPVDIYPRWNAGKDVVANVGYPVFSRMDRMVVDYGTSALYLARSERSAPPMRRRRLGLAFVPVNGGMRVLHVAAGSPADRSGWRAGEVVVAAADAARMDASTRQDMNTGPAGTAVTFTMADGSQRRLVRADYY